MSQYTRTTQQIEQLKAAWPGPASRPDGPPLAALFDSILRGSNLQVRNYAPGEVVFREGDQDDTMYIIQFGLVAVVKGDLDDPVVLAHRGAGDVFGEMALLDNQPRSASVIALDDVQLLCVRRADFEELLKSDPAPAMRILTMISTRLRMADDIRAAISRLEQKLARELEIAGQLQARLLPTEIPQLPGWEITATLIPARQTSGDYYDFIPLETGRLGIVVADVADKGAASALVMAVSRTLIHSFALYHPDAPDRVFEIANERLLSDTTSDLFVTAFYGVLDPASGQLVYVNAGHNPGYLFKTNGTLEKLAKTGVPLGMFKGVAWESRTIQIDAGDRLVLYTDGVTEACNPEQAEFQSGRLVEVVEKHARHRAADIQMALLAAVQDFVRDEPACDDITLMVVARG
jgi:serine phosphatase RsbU (regulator of sigma subunit)